MYYESTTTKTIIINLNTAFADCIKYLAWNDDVENRHATEFVCWGERRS